MKEGEESVKAEIHAHTFALKSALKYKLWRILESLLNIIALDRKDNNYHGAAARSLMKSKLWERCYLQIKFMSVLQRESK